jgi:hypothetical protein
MYLTASVDGAHSGAARHLSGRPDARTPGRPDAGRPAGRGSIHVVVVHERDGAMRGRTIDLLRASDLFCSLDDAALDRLALCAGRRRYRPDEVIFHAGDPGIVILAPAAAPWRRCPLTRGH